MTANVQALYEKNPRAGWVGAGFKWAFSMMGWGELHSKMPDAAAAIEAALRAKHSDGRPVSLETMARTFPRAVLDHLSQGERERAALDLPPLDGVPRSATAKAGQWVQDIARELATAKVHHAYDEAEIRDFAENYARQCTGLLADKDAGGVRGAVEFARAIGIEPPNGKDITPAAVAERLKDAHWWRRQLRKVWTREAENGMRAVGIISKHRQPYASDAAVEHRSARIERTRDWAKEREMMSDAGEALDLLPLMDKSIANPALRRGEFMTRVRGFEEIAKQLGHVAQFWTLTTPSRFHAQLSAGGINPKWEDERAKVRDAQLWLRQQWARSRTKLGRLGVRFYGFRVAEPHHDGTPHWHMVLFVEAAQAATLQAVLREFWLSDNPNEPGAQQYRIRCIDIDPTKGSAAGYVAKYVSKNIDGKTNKGDDALNGEVSDEADLEAGENARRVAAWASAHGIRQFQQVGGPPVGLWRELRRLRDPVAPALIESVRAEADAGNWREFINALGGLQRASRRARSVREKYRRDIKVPKVDDFRLAAKQWATKHGPRVVKIRRPARPEEMPAIWLDHRQPCRADSAGREVVASTRYGEAAPERAAGICSYGLLGRYVVTDTRVMQWKIRKKQTAGTGHDTESPADANTARESAADMPTRKSVAEFCRGGNSSTTMIAPSDSSPRSGVRSGLGPVAITIRTTNSDEERAAEVARIVSEVMSRPDWRPFDPGGYKWPADIPEFHKQWRH